MLQKIHHRKARTPATQQTNSIIIPKETLCAINDLLTPVFQKLAELRKSHIQIQNEMYGRFDRLEIRLKTVKKKLGVTSQLEESDFPNNRIFDASALLSQNSSSRNLLTSTTLMGRRD